MITALDVATGLRDFEDGIVGMWSGANGYANSVEMVMLDIKKHSTITETTFSFFLTGVNGNSYLDFGTPNEAAMSNPSDMIYIPTETDTVHW